MGRLPDFDYTTPFFYMVTLHAKKGLRPFSSLSKETASGLKSTPLTRRMKGVIFWMNRTRWVRQMKIHHFVIMPNHLHLIIKINPGEQRPSLPAIVKSLILHLSSAYCDELGLPRGQSIFEPQWHDWIVAREQMLNAFAAYIRENPRRALFRQETADACFPKIFPAKRLTWTCIGTLSPRETPVRVPVICSRSIQPESELWKEWQAFARRIGPGAIAIGTFMSPCEKMVRAEVLKAGGGIIQLVPRGIGPKCHASPEDERLLSAGRLTIMTPFPFDARVRLQPKELYDRCHTLLNPIAQSLRRGVDAIPASR